MAKININKKEQALIDSLTFNRDSITKETVRNPYSQETCELDARGVALYDYIKGCEYLRKFNDMQIGLTLFRKLYSNEYYVLLD